MNNREVSNRMIQLREAMEGTDRGAQTRFAKRLGMSVTRWNNIENGSAVSRDLAIELCQKFPGLTTDWIWLNREDGLSVAMRDRLAKARRKQPNVA